MMRKYEAKIVGFKWSQKRMAFYHPIFEYTNSRGEKKKYIRKRGMEKTPFTMRKKYYIYENSDGIYEKTEKRISPQFCFLLLKIAALLIAIVLPSIALLSALVSYAIYAIYKLSIFNKQIKAKKMPGFKRPVPGQIVGYQKARRVSLLLDNQYEFHPLIKYVYSGHVYTHISKSVCDENEYPINSQCNIYVNTCSKRVYDELELQLPLIDAQRVVKDIKTAWGNIEDADVKVYEPKSVVAETSSIISSDTKPIPVSLKTHQHVSGWY